MSHLRGSAIYWGEVLHHRQGGIQHRFTHRLPWFLLDLQELAQADRGVHGLLFNVNGPGLLSFYDRDHGARDGTPFLSWLRTLLADHGRHQMHFRALCLPRLLGYVFNPISVIYCFDSQGRLGAMVYEVHNTFGQSHAYVHLLSGVPQGPHASPKQFHVSPFFSMHGRYRFSISEPSERVAIGIHYQDDCGATLFAGFKGRRMDITTVQILKTLLRWPLATIGVTLNIHWQAARLWLKGARVHRNPNPENQHG